MIDHKGLCVGNPCSCGGVQSLIPIPQRLQPGVIGYIPLDQLQTVRAVPAGLNPYVVMSLAYKFRSTNEDVAPIVVTHIVGGGGYRIIDGRHRFVASLMAGRGDILAEVVEGA